MTQTIHDEVIAWIDKEVKFIDEIHPNGGNSKNVTSFWTNYRYCPKCLEDANINVLGMAGTADFCSMHLQNPKGASSD